ncbi:MAG: thioredoxin domain-containing protein [Deltaproteobacteria bacterium]|nr:thioredoxin domain-containing protein [Deltaproteobacteria bacterium]MCW5802253.1 thioredoxin domain-containing protein [Deltaproteobacteria bacterium]
MKKLSALACLLLVAASGCEKQPSKLDPSTGGVPSTAGAAAARGGGGDSGELAQRLAALEAKVERYREPLEVVASTIEQKKGDLKVDPYNLLDGRLRKLESHNDALAFLESVYQRQKAEQQKEEDGKPDPNGIFAIDVSKDIALGMVEGPATAPVTIVKAFDFACPYCMQMNDHLKALMKQNEGKIRVVYKNFVIHDNARAGHLGSCAAAKQGKYVAFKEAFWEKGYKPFLESLQAKKPDDSTMKPDSVVKIAGEVGLDTQRFEADMNGDECKQLIKEDMEELAKFEINSTPTLYINGTHFSGQPLGPFVASKVKEAEASGVAPGDYYDKVIMAKGEKQFRNAKTPKPATP